MSECPCSSGLEYDACCGPILSGDQDAPTAEALMRSRYTAYVKNDIDYLERSMHSKTRSTFDREATREWSESSEWLGLEIKSVDGGGEDDDKGNVEFVAKYSKEGEEESHHEIAEFLREKGRWAFLDGKQVKSLPYVRSTPKVGRNEPCPCGSGKKYKKCCG